MMAEILSWLNPWREVSELRERLEVQERIIGQQVDHLRTLITDLDTAQEALRAIIMEEKPTSNSTVKRMARMAREALKK
jgi:hypothetical protein